MDGVDSIIQQAERQCKAHGARLTTKRKQVLAGLLQCNKALSAYELIDYCHELYGASLSAMSVYRILEFLEEEQLVHKLNLANKFVACSHIRCGHTHTVQQFLICPKCSKVKEVSINPSVIAELQASVDEAGFKLISPQGCPA